jgi:hypothetical protein
MLEQLRILPAVLLIACTGSSGGSHATGTGGSNSGGGGGTNSGGGGGTPGTTGGATGTGGSSGAPACIGGDLAARLFGGRLAVGGSMPADLAPADIRYLYIGNGDVPDGTGTCASCATGCFVNGVSCAQSGCSWWGCWQWDQVPPGQYVVDFVTECTTRGQVPFFTYYNIRSLRPDGDESMEKQTVQDPVLMRQYLADFTFLADTIGARNTPVMLHFEPDFLAYMQWDGVAGVDDPATVPALAASASPECAGFADNVAGLGQCIVDILHRHAPRALIGLHLSHWGIWPQPPNDDAANWQDGVTRLVHFISAAGGAQADFLVLDIADRDAGMQQPPQAESCASQGTGAGSCARYLAYGRAVADLSGKPIVWWQLPVGNASLDNTPQHYRDNLVDWFFAHAAEVAAGGALAMLFGGGQADSTTPETDGGNFAGHLSDYRTSGGVPMCGP